MFDSKWVTDDREDWICASPYTWEEKSIHDTSSDRRTDRTNLDASPLRRASSFWCFVSSWQQRGCDACAQASMRSSMQTATRRFVWIIIQEEPSCTELWYVYFCTSLHVSQQNSLVMTANIRVHRLSNNSISCGPTQMRTAQTSNMQQMWGRVWSPGKTLESPA